MDFDYQFPVLMVLENLPNGRIIIFGAEYETRSDGTDAFAVAQAYCSNEDFDEGTTFKDEDGEVYKAMQPVVKGFHFSGIVMEWLTEENNETE